jgi:CRP/FNR family cyclic AMP-dependent transcriptional regulator
MDYSEITQVLEGCELFKGLQKDDIEKIAKLCQVETYKPGECVARQGDFGEYLYFIAEGQVILERSTDLGARTGNVTIGILGKGKAFGCWSTLLNGPHHFMCSATCKRPTTLVAVKGPALREMMVNTSRLGFCILERLCFLLRDRIQHAYGAMMKI